MENVQKVISTDSFSDFFESFSGRYRREKNTVEWMFILVNIMRIFS